MPRIKNVDVKSKNLVEGDPLVLECKAWGYPEVTVNWTKEDMPLNASDRYLCVCVCVCVCACRFTQMTVLIISILFGNS